MTQRPGVLAAVGIVSLLLVACDASAQQAPPGPEKSGADPTDFITRYEPSYEHRRLDDGSDQDLLVLRTDLALRGDLSLRLDFPLIGFRPDEGLERLGFDSTFGLGDIITQLIYKPYSGDRLAAIVGLRVDLDTATKGELGRGGTVVAPLAAVAWYPVKPWAVVPILQWFLGDDLDNDPLPGTQDRNALSIRPLIIWQPGMRHLAYILVDPEIVIDFENDDEVTATLGVEWGKGIGKGVLLFVKGTAGLTDDTTEWGIKIGFRHLFPGTFLFQ